MTRKSRHQLFALAGLVAVLVGVMTLRGGDDPADAPAAPSSPVAGTTGQRAPAAPATPVADVRLELLRADPREAPGSERNPFRFQPKAPPRPPPRAAEPEESMATAPRMPQGPPPPPPIPLTFIGMLSAPTQAGRVAIMSDGRGNTFQAREGDIIEGRYRLLRLGTDSVELAYLDGRGRQVIRLSGQ